MEVCPNCSHHNKPGVIFCENCGASLLGGAPIGTRNIGSKEEPVGVPGSSVTNLIEGAATDVFSPGATLRIEIGGAEALLVKPKSEMIFGRRDPATGAMPDIDLTPFAGYRMGVSRRHAAIRYAEAEQRLDLWDLGSSNGTFLNGTRLPAQKPHKLRDGDEIRLGQMIMRVYFQPAALSATQPPAPSSPAQSMAEPPPSPSQTIIQPNASPAKTGSLSPSSESSKTQPEGGSEPKS
jgi:hypothetical protein